MRSLVLIPLLSTAVLASWNSKICDGVGGCAGPGWAPKDPFRCPDGTLLNQQQTAGNNIDTSNGSYEIITKDEFPTSCQRGVKPADTDTLLVSFEPRFKIRLMLTMFAPSSITQNSDRRCTPS